MLILLKKYFLPLFFLISISPVKAFECRHAMTTIEINQCAVHELERLEKVNGSTLQQAIDLNQDDLELIKLLQESQIKWQAYRDAYCESVYKRWEDGSIRNIMAIQCKIDLTQTRTDRIRFNFLGFKK